MARKFFKRLMPHPERLRQHRSLDMLGKWLHDPNLWHLTRYSVSTAFFIGLFTAFLPIPAQMLVAGLAAVVVRANLPISVALVWVSNPLTMPPMFYLAYRVGATLLHRPIRPFEFELSVQWVTQSAGHIWQPLLLGSVLCGLFFGLLGGSLVRVLWRAHVLHRWHVRMRERQQRRRQHQR